MSEDFFYIYAVTVGSFIDDALLFASQEEADKCRKAEIEKRGIPDDFEFLNVQPMKILKRYNPEDHGHDKKQE